MSTFHIGDAEVEFRPIGAGVWHGMLPEVETRKDWELTRSEARDFAAFQKDGWQFVGEEDADWAKIREINDERVEACVLARHPGGGLVMLRNHVVVTVRPGGVVPPLDPPLLPVSFADDIFDFHIRLTGSHLDQTLHSAIALWNAFDGSTTGEPLV